MLPLAVPGLVMAFGYLAMSQEGKIFAFLNATENPTALLIIAYTVRKLPFVVRSAAAGLQQTSVAYEEAAQNLGCPPFRATLRITLPLIAASVMAGALLAFSQSMLEVSDSLILAQKARFIRLRRRYTSSCNYSAMVATSPAPWGSGRWFSWASPLPAPAYSWEGSWERFSDFNLHFCLSTIPLRTFDVVTHRDNESFPPWFGLILGLLLPAIR